MIARHCKDTGRDPAEVRITRMATLFPTDAPAQSEQVRDFLRGAGGEEFLAGCDVGQPDELHDRFTELEEAGVQTFIFNMPMADPAAVRRAGELLASRWG